MANQSEPDLSIDKPDDETDDDKKPVTIASDEDDDGANEADWLAFHKRNSDANQTVPMKRAQKRAFRKWKTIRYYQRFSKDDCMVRLPKTMPVFDETDDGWIRYSDLSQRHTNNRTFYSHTLLPWNCIPVGQPDWHQLIHRSSSYLVAGRIRGIDDGLIIPTAIIRRTHYSYTDGNRLFSLMDFDDIDSIRQLRRQQQADGVLSVSTESYRRFCLDIGRLLAAFVVVSQLRSLIVGYSHAY